MNTFETLLSKIDTADHLDFGTILSTSLELFKKVWVQGLILMAVLFGTMIPFMVFVYLPMFQEAMTQVRTEALDPNQVGNSLGAMTAKIQYITLGFVLVYTFLSTALVAGFYRIVKKIDHEETYAFSDFFYFFRGRTLDKLCAIAAFSLLLALLNLVFEKFLPGFSASLLKMGITFIFSVYSSLFVLFLAFNTDLEVSDIFVLSFKLGSRKWALLFGLLVVGGILGMLGIIACGVGVLFTFSLFYLPFYTTYKTLFGFDTRTDIDRIGADDI